MKVASCVRTKDSGRYLPEWLAYHWVLGVDEFLVLDDQSEDDTRPVRPRTDNPNPNPNPKR